MRRRLTRMWVSPTQFKVAPKALLIASTRLVAPASDFNLINVRLTFFYCRADVVNTPSNNDKAIANESEHKRPSKMLTPRNIE